MPQLDHLTRFFHHLVHNLAATDRAQLRRPLPLLEVRKTIIPYRANRRALQLESSEDYELVLMRLCAGEGGFAHTEPAEIHAKFVAETKSSNPDLSIVLRHEEAALVLNEAQLARALTPPSDLAFAPPDQRPAMVAPTPLKVAPVERAARIKKKSPVPANCRACGGKLPAIPNLKFCPDCGESQSPTSCALCDTKLEPTWKHCVACGSPGPVRSS